MSQDMQWFLGIAIPLFVIFVGWCIRHEVRLNNQIETNKIALQEVREVVSEQKALRTIHDATLTRHEDDFRKTLSMFGEINTQLATFGTEIKNLKERMPVHGAHA